MSEARLARIAFPSLDPRSDVLRGERERARAVGYAEGLQAGAAEVAAREERLEAEATQALAAAMAELHQAAQALRTAAQRVTMLARPVLAEAEHAVVEGGLELAEAIVGVELDDAPNGARAALARVLAHESAAEVVRVRLHPDDLGMLDPALRAEAGVPLVADPSIRPGDALGECPDGVIEATIAGAMTRARAALEGAWR